MNVATASVIAELPIYCRVNGKEIELGTVSLPVELNITVDGSGGREEEDVD